MAPRKFLVTALLLLVPFLASFQMVSSQQYATTTATSLVTSIQVSTVPVATQVMTTTSGPVTPVYVGGNVTITGTHGVCGEYFNQAFNATAGEILTGTVSASSPVNIYVLTSSAFQSWLHQVVAGGTCTPPSPVFSQTGNTSYTLGVTIPTAGFYDLVVNNLSHSTISVQITANLVNSAPSLVTAVIYSTATQPLVQTVMQTSVQTMQTTSSPPASGPDVTALAIVALIIVVVIAIGAYFAKARRGKSKAK